MGYHDEKRVMSVEYHKGGWILRAVLAGDCPATECPEAAAAMHGYMARTEAKFNGK